MMRVHIPWMADSDKHRANTSGDPSADSAVAQPAKRAKTGGRVKGVKNRRTVEIERWLRPLLPGAKRKLKALVSSDDDSVALKAALAVVAYIYGKPVAPQEITGADGERLISKIERVIVDPSRPRPAAAAAPASNGHAADDMAESDDGLPGHPTPQETRPAPAHVPTPTFTKSRKIKIISPEIESHDS